MKLSRALCVAGVLAWGCKSPAPAPPTTTPSAAASSAAAPTSDAAPGSKAAPASQAAAPSKAAPTSAAAPASQAADPREAKAAAKCSPLVSAVVINGAKLSTFPKVAPAFAAARDGGLVWICPGAHPVNATLALKGVKGVTVAGKDALILAVDDRVVLRIDGAAQTTLRGVNFGHAMPVGQCGSDVVQAKAVKGLTVQRVGLHGSGIVGLALSEVSDAVVEDSLFVECETGLTATGPKPTTRGNRFFRNDRHLGQGLAAHPSDRLGPVRTPPPEAADPVEPGPLADAAPAPLVEALGQRWAVLGVELFAELKRCDRDPKTNNCRNTLPAKPAPGAAAKAAVTVVGSAGPCTASLGPPRLLERRGCEPSVLTVRALKGCAGPVAPVAFSGADAAVAQGLRWIPREGTKRGAKAPPALQAWIDARLQDDVVREAVVKASPKGHWATLRWTADAGDEQLVTHGLGIQIDLGDCHLTERTMTAGWLGAKPLTVPQAMVNWTPWRGVLAKAGKVWGVVGRGPLNTTLHLRQGDALVLAYEGAHATDNEECVAGSGALGFEYPCGP